VVHASRSRRIAAVALSLVCPGAGQFLVGRYRGGVVWVLVRPLVFALAVTWHVFAVLLGIAVHVACAVDAGLVRSDRHLPPLREALAVASLSVLAFLSTSYATRRYVVEGLVLNDASMVPTLEPRDHIFVKKFGARALAGDVVVARLADSSAVLRVIAVGGQAVNLRDGVPTIDGGALPRRATSRACSSGATGCSVHVEVLGDREYGVSSNTSSADLDVPGERLPCPEYTALSGDRSSCVIAAGHLFLLADARIVNAGFTPYVVVDEAAVVGNPTHVWLAEDTARLARFDRIGAAVE
jgi:signal peptidase I